MASSTIHPTVASSWLRSPNFDLTFIGLPLILALLSGIAVVTHPHLFYFILMVDLWILGYHHVISTYTRLCFDKKSYQQHKFLILYLPFIVFAATIALAFSFGIWLIFTIYLYWQWFHYTRQSWGISQVYRRKSNGTVSESLWVTQAAFYLLPFWGIVYRSWQAPEKFLGTKIWVIPTPEFLVYLTGIAAIGSILIWGYQRIRAFAQGQGSVPHTLYMLSHWCIFGTGYLLIEDITFGWLVINIWHNAQYIFFVWLFNTNRFKNGIDDKARFLSMISQPKMWWAYLVVCLAITTILYTGLNSSKEIFLALGIPSMIVIYQTINFHHYIVDALIWKARKKPMQKTMGLS
ncbi:MAG: hypothetical protein AAF530_10550 [Pseudomonadota bacterium]